jgi:hypothetical protein
MPTKTPGLMRVVQVSEADCVQGARAERFAAQTEFQDPTCSISEYRTRYDVGSAIHDELTFYKNGQPRTVFRGMHDEPENKTVTEIQMKIRAAEQRMLRSVLDNMSVSRPMQAPSGLSMLMNEQRRQEKQLRMLTQAKCDAAAARIEAVVNGKPIESTDFWAELDKASHLGGSAFARFKANPVAEVKLQTPANPGLADVNAKLQELSGETLKFKRFKPQLTGDWSVDPTQL